MKGAAPRELEHYRTQTLSLPYQQLQTTLKLARSFEMPNPPTIEVALE
jgi:hypothetical protein